MDNLMQRETGPAKVIKKLIGKIEKLESTLKIAGSADRKKVHKEVDDLKAELAWQYLEANELEKAAKIYENLPKDEYVQARYCGKARILIENQKFDEALELLKEALTKLPDSLPILNTLGIVFNQTGDYYEALRYFDRVLAADPQGNPSTLYNKVFSLRNLGYHAEEHKLLLDLLKDDPNNPDFLAALAYCEGQRGNYREALEGCKKALENGCKKAELYAWLCKAYLNLDCFHELCAVASAGLGKYPAQDAMLYTYLGMGHMALEQFEEARTALECGLRVDPEAKGIQELLQTIEKVSTPRNNKKERGKPRTDSLVGGGLS